MHLRKYLCNYNIGFEIVMSHFRNTPFIDDSFIPVDRLYICGMYHVNIRGIGRSVSEIEGNSERYTC